MRDLVRQIIAAYRSTRLEGQDESAIVFSGQELDTRQPVWIRIVPRLLGEDPRIAARFRSLAQSIRQLNHPNITAVRSVGEKGGLPYIVEGVVAKAQPLARRLNQPWAVDAAADVVMQAGQALEHAYKKGVMHGSLSPHNILIQDSGQVKIAGFGLSQLLDLLGVQIRQALTPYMAPERTSGKETSPRADVYSLGAILYSLLAGRAPQAIKGQVVPPGRFNPEVPAAMDQVILKALSPDPAGRYADVKSFLLALGAVKLAPAAAPAESKLCPTCGTENLTGRFCRKCGTRLAEPEGAAPPRAVPAVSIGPGVEVHDTLIAPSALMPQGEPAAPFPEPLPMPQVALDQLWAELSAQIRMAMPQPPPMPVIDWAEVAPVVPQMPTIERAQGTQSLTP